MKKTWKKMERRYCRCLRPELPPYEPQECYIFYPLTKTVQLFDTWEQISKNLFNYIFIEITENEYNKYLITKQFDL